MIKRIFGWLQNISSPSLDNRLSSIEKKLDSIDDRLASIDQKIHVQIGSNIRWSVLSASLAVLAIMLTVGYELPERNMILFIASFSFAASFLIRLFRFLELMLALFAAFVIEAILIFTVSQISELEQGILGFVLLGLFFLVLILWYPAQSLIGKMRRRWQH